MMKLRPAWILVLVAAILAPATVLAQAPSAYIVRLPAIYRQVPMVPGILLTVVSSRLTPDLKLAVLRNGDGQSSTFDLLLSTDAGLSFGPVDAQPWQDQAPAPPGWWSDMLSPRILILKGTVTLVVAPLWVRPAVLYLSEDYGHTWVARSLPQSSACGETGIGQVLTTPAAPDRLLVSATCTGIAGSDPGLLSTSDGGVTWTFLDPWTPETPTWSGNPVGSALDAGLLYRLNGTNWQRTLDLGASWEERSIPGDELVLSPNDDRILVAQTRSTGIHLVSSDGGDTWRGWRQDPCRWVVSPTFQSVWLRGTVETLIRACEAKALTRSRDLGQSWDVLILPQGLPQFLVVADDALPDTLYVQTVNDFGPPIYWLYRSQDAGDTWEAVRVSRTP